MSNFYMDTESLDILIKLAFIHLLALLSPGPDYVLITRNALVFSRKTGFYTAIGLGIGIIIHVSYSMAGLGVLLKHNQTVFHFIQALGGVYLLYIGIMAIRSTFSASSGQEFSFSKRTDISKFVALKMGFLTNVLNPKAGMYFISVFTQFIKPQTGEFLKLFVGLEVIILTTLYFSFVAYMISHKKVRTLYLKSQKHIDRLLGLVLVIFGTSILYSAFS